MNHKVSPFKYLLESAIIEAFDLPKVTPKYHLEPTYYGADAQIPEIDMDVTMEFKKDDTNWEVNFSNPDTQYELTGKNDLTVIPKVFSVLFDIIDKAKVKPKTLSFNAKAEKGGKDKVSLIPEAHKEIVELTNKLFKEIESSDLDIVNFKALEAINSIKDTLLNNDYKQMPHTYTSLLEEYSDKAWDDFPENCNKAFRKLTQRLDSIKTFEIIQKNRRATIYMNLIKKYKPDVKIKEEGTKVTFII